MFDSGLEENLWETPSLPLLLDRIHHRLDDERLKRSEFRSWLTEDTKAEFINGSVVMHSPAAEDHNEAVLNLGSIANIFSNFNQLGKVRVEKALIGMTRNDYEPDIAFWKKEVADRFQPGMNIYPVPDLAVEVLSPGPENVKRDTKTKFEDYAAHQVPEYWIVDPKKKTVEQYLLSETNPGTYELHKKAILTDDIESIVMTGFSIPVRAIFEAEANAQTIQRIFEGRS